MIVIPINIIPPPRRKRHRFAACAKDGEGENKEHSETGAVKGTADNCVDASVKRFPESREEKARTATYDTSSP